MLGSTQKFRIKLINRLGMPGILLFLASCAAGLSEAEVAPRPQPLSTIEINFSKSVLDKLQLQSFADNREYCGYVAVSPDGSFAASSPRRGGRNGCVPRLGATQGAVLASYHTHGAASDIYDTEYPSFEDLYQDIIGGVDGYIATPGGRVWYNNARLRRTILLCGAGCITADPRHRDTDPPTVGVSYSIDELRDP